jgi:FKBP-type peptidyl-prolyl cis-trans isomerase 2
VSCGGSSSTRYIITSVNETAGTYTEDFNQEVGGQTLIFLVKVINLFTPAVNDTVSA